MLPQVITRRAALQRTSVSYRILLVEDDAEIAEFVAQGLQEEGFRVERAADGHSALQAIRASIWDLVILDWWLPGPSGLDVLLEYRNSGKTAPVLFLTARDGVAQRVEGLKTGADDYLCKPFAFEELIARVYSLLRRQSTYGGTQWQYHDILVDPTTNRAERAGQSLSLTAREQLLLLFFLRHPGQVLSRTRLYEQVWEDRYDGISNTLEVHVMELRRKLEAFGPRVIQTVRGRGYILQEPSTAEKR
jgi:two-component system, OmpR family, copper resistance phosphate regulon response regulator CusR